MSLLSNSPTEACAYDQVDGSDLAWCVELFESVLTSSSWASLKTPATSAMESLGQTLSTCRKEILTINLS